MTTGIIPYNKDFSYLSTPPARSRETCYPAVLNPIPCSFAMMGLHYRSSPKFDHNIGRLFLHVWINFPISPVVDHFDEIHQIPLRDDMLCRDDSLVLVSLPGRAHIECAIILILVDAAIAQANGFDT